VKGKPKLKKKRKQLDPKVKEDKDFARVFNNKPNFEDWRKHCDVYDDITMALDKLIETWAKIGAMKFSDVVQDGLVSIARD